MKTCSKCQANKPEAGFSKNKNNADGLHVWCKTCCAEQNKLWRQAHPNYEKERHARCGAIRNAQDRARRAANPEPFRAKGRRARLKNKAWYQAYERRRNQDPIRKMKHNRRTQAAARTRIDVKIALNLRRRIIHVLHGTNKSAATMDLLGCTIDQFLGHLEINFQEGMNWENYGKVWEMDHKKPCALFDLTDPAQQRACFHWKNIQPLFLQENRSKQARYEEKE